MKAQTTILPPRCAFPSARMTALLIIIVSAISPMANGEVYLPLSVGSQWEYIGLGGNVETHRVEGIVEIWGSDVYETVYEGNPANEGLRHYWTCDETGTPLFWGFYDPEEEFGALYDPPVRMADTPLQLGKTWVCLVDTYILPDTTFEMSVEITFEVEEEGPLIVPAGEYYAFGISNQAMPGEAPATKGNRDLMGYVIGPDRQPLISDWWSDGVGRVQYLGAYQEVFQLTEFQGPTPVERKTWGSIKALYSQ